MNDSSDKKLENVRNIQFIREFLGTTNLDAQLQATQDLSQFCGN